MNYINCILVACCLLTIELAIAESNCTCEQLYLRVPDNCSNIFDKVEELCNDVLGDDKTLKNGTCEDDDLAACEKLEEKYDMVNSSFEAFKTLLDMTVVNVLLREENRNRCMISYKRWLCATQFTFYNNSTDGNSTCKPSIGVCNRVVQNCPYYTPARHQNVNNNRREVIYGGLPAFMCPVKGTDEDSYVHGDDNDINFHCVS